jgi:purine catabolism regulator
VLTLRTLVEEMGLELRSGAEAADAPVRWVHITELPDPTPWLSGGELILTTGLQLTSAKRQRELVRRLSGHHLAGLGFGTGFEHDSLPDALLDEAVKLGFPVFEVPYELPFIALTEQAFTRLVNEQYEVLQRGIALHKRLERLVLEERGLDELVRALSAAIGGAVTVLNARGEVIASRAFRREMSEAATASLRDQVMARGGAGSPDAGEYGEFAPDHPDLAGRALAMPVFTGGQGPPQAWLAAARDAGGLGDFERLILQQAATVVALELMRQRAMRDTERRLGGDVLAETLTGGLAEREVASRLRPFNVGPEAAVLVFAPATALFANGSADDQAAAAAGWAGPDTAEGELDRFLRDAGIGALVATRDRLLCAVVDAGGDGFDAVELAGRARDALAAEGAAPLRAAASRPAPVGTLRRTFHEARCALEAVAMANGSGPDVASYRDLGAFQLLLSLHDDEALRLYCDSVLGPLEEAGGEYGGELIRSLEAFIEQNGQWEKAARALYCHRHTLRYRIRRVEELTGRDLKSARDRIEFWLALRARELV